MKLVSDDSRIFSPIHHRPYTNVIKIGENILESSENKFMNLLPYVFDVDYAAKIRSELSVTVLEKKRSKLSLVKMIFA